MRWLVAAALVFASACDLDQNDGIAAARLDHPRILGVQTWPTVPGSDEYVTLEVLAVDVGGRRIEPTTRWRVCDPWSTVADPDVDCGPGRSLVLGQGGGRFSFRTSAVLTRFPVPDDYPTVLDFYDIPVVVDVSVAGESFTTVRRVRTSRNRFGIGRRNPRIANVLLDGVPVSSGFEPGNEYELEVVLDPSSIDVIEDDDFTLRVERVKAFPYMSGGEIADMPLVFSGGSTTIHERIDTTTWRAPETEEEVTFWIVAVDGDWGVGWQEF